MFNFYPGLPQMCSVLLLPTSPPPYFPSPLLPFPHLVSPYSEIFERTPPSLSHCTSLVGPCSSVGRSCSPPHLGTPPETETRDNRSLAEHSKVWWSVWQSNLWKITFMSSRAVFHCDIDQRLWFCLVQSATFLRHTIIQTLIQNTWTALLWNP